MYSPFTSNNIEKFIMALSYPSAACFEMDEECAKEIKRSHIIFISPSINLFIRYMSELHFNFDLDFADAIPVTVNCDEYDYSFLSIREKKAEIKEEMR